MKIDIFDPVMTTLVNPDTELELLASGFKFIEGPVWNTAQGCLYFSDIPANTIYRFVEGKGVDVYRHPSRFSNGLTIDQQGRLLAAEHRGRQVTRESSAGLEVLATHYQGKRLNSPNDIIVASDGTIFFTDPPYGLMDNIGGPAEKELPFCGVYRLPPGATEPILISDDFTTPNGLALNADETRLYVDDTLESHLRMFNVGEGWTMIGGDVVVAFPKGEHDGVPDGLKLDVHDNVYVTGPFGVWVISPANAVLGRIHLPEVTANLNWGDADAHSLYLTASTGLYRIRCETHGTTR